MRTMMSALREIRRLRSEDDEKEEEEEIILLVHMQDVTIRNVTHTTTKSVELPFEGQKNNNKCTKCHKCTKSASVYSVVIISGENPQGEITGRRTPVTNGHFRRVTNCYSDLRPNEA